MGRMGEVQGHVQGRRDEEVLRGGQASVRLGEREGDVTRASMTTAHAQTPSSRERSRRCPHESPVNILSPRFIVEVTRTSARTSRPSRVLSPPAQPYHGTDTRPIFPSEQYPARPRLT